MKKFVYLGAPALILLLSANTLLLDTKPSVEALRASPALIGIGPTIASTEALKDFTAQGATQAAITAIASAASKATPEATAQATDKPAATTSATPKATASATPKATAKASTNTTAKTSSKSKTTATPKASATTTPKTSSTTTSKSTSSPATSASTASSASATTASKIISTAKTYLGVPYVWGGTTPSGFDCSGFIQYVFAQHGITLPRVTSDQYQVGTAVSKSNLIPGDLVFFETYKPGASHVGIYLGSNQFIHASSGSNKVMISNLTSSYYTSHYLGSRRVLK